MSRLLFSTQKLVEIHNSRGLFIIDITHNGNIQFYFSDLVETSTNNQFQKNGVHEPNLLIKKWIKSLKTSENKDGKKKVLLNMKTEEDLNFVLDGSR